MTMAPDDLRTARLVLRALAPADEAALVALSNDPDVGRYLWDSHAVAAARLRNRRELPGVREGGIGLYAAQLAEAPGAVIGAAGLARIGGQLEPELLDALLPAF